MIKILLYIINNILSLLSLFLIYPVTSLILEREKFLKKLEAFISNYFYWGYNEKFIIIFLSFFFLVRFFFGIFSIKTYTSFIKKTRFHWSHLIIKRHLEDFDPEIDNGTIFSDSAYDTFNASTFLEGIIDILISSLYILIFLCLLYVNDLRLGLISSIVFSLFLTIVFLTKKKSWNLNSRGKSYSQTNWVSFIHEIILSKKDIYIYSISKLALNELKIRSDKFLNILSKNFIRGKLNSLYSETIINGLIISVIVFFLIKNSSFKINDLPYFLLIFTIGIKCINQTNQILVKIIKVSIDFSLFIKVIDKIHLHHPKLPEDSDFPFNSQIKEIIIPKFKFQIDEFILFKCDGLKLEANRHYLLIGNTGSGKSTFLDILTQTNEKKIEIQVLTKEGKTLKNNKQYYSYVSQNIGLYGENIKDLIIGSEPYNKEKLNSVIRICFLQDLKDRKQINVDKLSGGEKSRIGIARALYYDRPIIILDEILSSVPFEMEKQILNSIKIKDKILIQVSHERIPNHKVFKKILIEQNKIKFEKPTI